MTSSGGPADTAARVAHVLEVHQVEYIDAEVGFECGCNERGGLYLPNLLAVFAHQGNEIARALDVPSRPPPADGPREAAIGRAKARWEDADRMARLLVEHFPLSVPNDPDPMIVQSCSCGFPEEQRWSSEREWADHVAVVLSTPAPVDQFGKPLAQSATRTNPYRVATEQRQPKGTER